MELNGVTLLNNSFVDFDDIPNLSGTGGAFPDDNVLLCLTTFRECCNSALQILPAPLGEWYRPNGVFIDFDITSHGTTYRRNRAQSVVRLWRRNDPPERGRFHCEIPIAPNDNRTIYVHICELSHELSLISLDVKHHFHSGHWSSDHLSLRFQC